MKKNKKLLLGLIGLIVIVYNVLLFTMNNAYGGKDKWGMAFWMAYGFIMFAVLVLLSVVSGLFGGKKDSSVFGIPLLFVTMIYLGLEFIAGTILMIVKSDNPFINVIPQIVLLLAYLILAVPTLMAKNSRTERNEQIKAKVGFIRDMTGMAEAAAAIAVDADTANLLKKFAEDIKYSDPMSHASLASLENELEVMINKIKDAADHNAERTAELVRKAKGILTERNIRCKALK